MRQAKLRRIGHKLGVALRPNAMGQLYRRSWAQAWRSGKAGAAILVYHRIADSDLDPQLMCVSPANFTEHLAAIRAHYHAVPLTELVRRLARGESVAGMVVITFDDGYVDNLHGAKPLLARQDTPATVFATADHIGATTEFWWDELERLLLTPHQLPEQLVLDIDRGRHEWRLNGDASVDASAHRAWTVLDRAAPTERHRIYLWLCTFLNTLTYEEQQRVLAQLQAWAGAEPRGRDSHRTMTAAELNQLIDGGLIDVGGHTVTHPVLSRLSFDEQMAEIKRGKDRLEEVVGRRVASFAYPYGAITDYKGETVRAVRACGFDHAVSTFADTVRATSDPFQLPRFTVRNWSGEQFAHSLREWIGG
jgi:peptidoglycan/xylan/chitin deacetylase (PgdA/CDA1 family)